MPITRRFDRDDGVLYVSATGAVADAELLEFARALLADALPHGRRELIDLCGLEKAQVSSAILRTISNLFGADDKTAFESRVAIVARSDVAYGLARMYQAFRMDAPIVLRVFRELGEARAWLGLTPE